MKRALVSLFVVLCFILGVFPVKSFAAVSVSAKSAILLDADTGKILFEEDAYAKRPMASTTKIMTALLCLESSERDTPFKVDSTAIRVEGSSMGLLDGDIVTLKTLAVGQLMLSGNDAANAAAVRISGDSQGFAQKMNERAAEIGMKSTNFVTPSGLHDDKHYSTAYDMALLGAEAIKNPDFLEICSKSRYTVSYGQPEVRRTFSNHNRLVRELEGCIGIKTGFTKKAGRCLVSAVKRGGRTLVCVTLSAPNDWQDHKSLYDYGFSLYKETPAPKEELPALPIVNSEHSEILLSLAGEAPELFVREGEKVECKITLRPFEYAPVFKGQVVGSLYYCVGDTVLGERTIIAAKSAHHLWQKQFEEKKNPFEKLIDWLFSLFK